MNLIKYGGLDSEIDMNCLLFFGKYLDRNKIQEGEKRIGEVLDWYEEVNSQTLSYVTFSIHDSDISDFYRKDNHTYDVTIDSVDP